MILFLSQNNDNSLENFVKNFYEKTKIKTLFYTIQDLHKNGGVSIACRNNRFVSRLGGIDFNDIKICYINSCISFYNENFDFKKRIDREYAASEYNASLLCLLESAKKTKFINPFLKKYACNTELEHILLFQRFNLDTAEMFLTNSSENLLMLYDIYKNNLIIKNILMRICRSKPLLREDLKKLNKLYLSPYLFQKPERGEKIDILLLGEDAAAYCGAKRTDIPLGLKERLIGLKNELNVPLVMFSAVYNEGKYYFYSLNQAPSFRMPVSIPQNDFETLLENYLIKEYNN